MNPNVDTGTKYKFLKTDSVGIIGVTIKEGQNLEGPEKAPEALRENGLYKVIKSLGWEYKDYGDIKDENLEMRRDDEEAEYKYSKIKNCTKLGAVNKKLHDTVKEIAQNGQFGLILGGDHGLASGSISGLKQVYSDLKIIWVDAHADANTPETSPSAHYHGMPAAHLLGWMGEKNVPGFDWLKTCLTNEDIVYIGLRDLDNEEKKNLKKHNIKCFTMHEVLKFGIGAVVEKALEYLKKDGKEHPIHLSFDVDGIDPSVAYGTGTKSRGGLLYREAHYIIREAAATGCLVSMDLVEINPLLDVPKEHFHGDNKYISGTETVSLGLELIGSALGDTLL